MKSCVYECACVCVCVRTCVRAHPGNIGPLCLIFSLVASISELFLFFHLLYKLVVA